MKRKILILFILSGVINQIGICQIPEAPVNVQAPNAAAFTIISDFKTTSFSGSPSINIELCKLSDGKIGLPINLSHDARGIKPDVHPGWVGLNNNLNVGGSIVRTIKDGIDDNPFDDSRGVEGYFFTNAALETSTWNTTQGIIDLADNGFSDKEPDEFSFQAMDISGKFYLGSDGQWKVQSEQNIKVELIGNTSATYPPFTPPSFTGNIWYSDNDQKYLNHSAGFILTDEKGTKYEFGAGDNSFMEYSMDFFDQGKDTWICNAWHLKSVTTLEGQTITYTYERGDFVAQMYFSVYNRAYSVNGMGFLAQSCSGWTSTFSDLGPYTGKLISPIYLKEVNTNNIKVSFESSVSAELPYDEDIFTQQVQYVIDHPQPGKASRIDILTFLHDCIYPIYTGNSCTTPLADLLTKLKWRKLDKIKITDTYKNTVEKEFEFIYDNSATERLRLHKIQEKGNNLLDKINPYEFIYSSYENYNLPNYCKSHTDHWGFNNGLLINQNNDFNSYSTYGTNYRNPATNPIYSLPGSINKIKFPTGGIKEFTFEQNTYSKEVKLNRNLGVDTYIEDKIAGGLRLKKLKSIDPIANNPTVETEYFYLNSFNPADPTPTTPLLSSGVVGGKSQYYWNDYKPTAADPGSYPDYTEEIFTTQSILPVSENSMGNHVGYSEIVEKSSTAGWTVFKYSNFDNGNNSFLDESFEEHLQQASTPYEPYNSKAYKRGKLIELANYDNTGIAMSKTNYNYVDIGSEFARSVKTLKKAICNTFNYIYEGTANKIYTNKYKLSNEESLLFDKTTPSQSVLTTTNYLHNTFGQINEIKKSESDGSLIISRIKYVQDYNRIQWNQIKVLYKLCQTNCTIGDQSCLDQCLTNYNTNKNTFDSPSRAILEMYDMHVWLPVETINYRNRNSVDKIIGGNLSVFKMFNSIPLLEKVNKIHLKEPLISGTVTFSEINASKQFISTGLYNQPEITFNNYNSAGNPTQITGRNGLVTSYVWGYRNRFPIAEIKNETYSNIAAGLGSDENLLLNVVVSEAGIRTKINALRTSNARKITTYTHDVIFGVKSMTNPANINTFFDYGGLGKLKIAKDHQQKILKDIVYQYAGQTEQTGLGATPTNTFNYIATRMPRTAQDNIITNIDETTTTIGYVDGLGRPVQSIIWKGSPDEAKDIISSTSLFDVAGRNHKSILTTRSNGILGQFKSVADGLAQTFYRDTVTRNETIFEQSPLSRPIQQFGPGQEWRVVNNLKPQKFFYETTGTMSIPLYTADENGIIKGTANYPNHQLFMTRVQDEKGNEMVELKDVAGKTIQKRIINDGGELLITHFVYNDLNQLKGVIQPKVYPLSNDLPKTADNLFFYNYDIRGRIIEKKIPASDPENFVYDQWDRLVLSQTPLQKTANKWSFYKYDVFNREILRGEKVYNASDTQLSLQNQAALNNNRAESRNSTTPIFYNFNSSFPVLGYVQNNANTEKIYQINYYDSYEYTNNWAAGLDYVPNETIHAQITLNGSLTGTKVLANPTLSNNNWLRTAIYYDFKNRLIQSRKEHLLATDANTCSYDYNFAGELLKKKTTHKKSGQSDLIELVVNTLDHVGRVKYIDHSIGNITKRIAVYEYDDIGRMATKNLGAPANFTGSNSRQSVVDGNWNTDATWHNFQIPNAGSLVEITHLVTIPTGENAYAGSIILNTNTFVPNGTLTLGDASSAGNALQKVDYQHHIRGGLSGINLDMAQSLSLNSTEKDFFSYKLEYDFDYNIKKQSWKHEGIENNRSYDFTYDKAHRLQTATYLPAGQDISITNLDYDKNGNITKLERDGKIGTSYGQIDNLTYDYPGDINRLMHMQESIPGSHDGDYVRRGNQNYTYYNDGSLKSDDNEGITEIIYDTFLRQPTQMTLIPAPNTTTNRIINYIYAGSGELLQTNYSTTPAEQWNNVENLTYKNSEYYSINTVEGRINYTNNNWEYEYFITDHLGNVRVSFKDNGSGVATKTAVTDRDPLGIILRNTQVLNGFQNRNEYQSALSELTFGLNRIDLGARTVNPTIGKMDRIDNYSEKYLSLSPFQYANNNTLRYVDINGDSLWISFKGQQILYNNTQLYNEDGTAYTGKIKGFLKETVTALSNISSSKDGADMLTSLSDSKNNFVIENASNNKRSPGSNEFADNNKGGAYAIAMLDEMQGNPKFGGSGGSVYWNPNDGFIQELGGGINLRPLSNLAHELFHAFDSDNGILDNRIVNKLKRDEWRASFFENSIRGHLGYPLREYYNTKNGPVRLLDISNMPISMPAPSINWLNYLKF